MLIALYRWLCRYNRGIQERLKPVHKDVVVTCVHSPLDVLWRGYRSVGRPWVLVTYAALHPSDVSIYDIVIWYSSWKSARDGAQAIIKRVYAAIRKGYRGVTV